MRKKLKDYDRKRDFRKTPEPAPGPARRPGDEPVFVIHRHEATRLHYDLRLEMEGVLKSFAVPRGLSYVPADKHLAVRTEDHPISYEEFEGVIPRGAYGAGTMTIWDRGTYDLLNVEPTDEGIAEGKLEFVLHGTRARGEWHLVKTGRDEKDWLLFKAKDAYARGEEERPFPFDLALNAVARGRPPRKATPMRPRDEVEAFSDPDWLFEAELRGLRAFGRVSGGEASLVHAKTGKTVEGEAEEVLRALSGIHAEDAVVDGVLTASGGDGRPSKEVLVRRLGGGPGPLVYYAFDLLHYDDRRVRELPLADRKRLLASVLAPAAAVQHVDPVRGEGEGLAETVARAGLPGVIAKRADSRYRGGASAAWRRIPVRARPEARGRSLADSLGPSSREQLGRVRFTNREKTYWREKGLTKGDLLDYYVRVAEHLVAHLRDRPVHMRRFPDGIEGKSFYHKNAPDHVPDWIRTESIESASSGKAIDYILVNDAETLLLLANLGSIDLHPWMSRVGSLDTPDYVVFDFDPDGSPFPMVVKAAREVGKVLRGIGLRPLLKTSGASGLHVTVPLLPRYTYDQTRAFAEMVALSVVRDHPDACTVERAVARRRGRVYIDCLQNRRGQTVVPPYVVRPVPAASVSTPLDWDELGSGLDPAAFDLEAAAARVERRGDLSRAVFTDLQDLAPALAAFEEHFSTR